MTNKRIESIDLLRGVVMVIMALDHVRDFFHFDAFYFDPTDLTQSNPALFWTRFVTHFCAPVFVFLAGTSAFFVGQKMDSKSLSIWLIKRGIWLVFAELTIIKLAWMFQLNYSSILLQVIWVLGISMIFLAGFIHLPKKLIISISFLVIIGHNLFDGFAPDEGFISGIWSFLHVFNIVGMGGSQVFVGYPMIPWIFVMPLGYFFGQLYLPSVDPEFRVKKLFQIGSSLTLLFFALRFLNIYGDPYFWSEQSSLSFTIMSFFNVSKYPPSLLYLLITLGPSILFLSIAENWQGKLNNAFITIGRVPMFFYILHIFVIHALGIMAAMLTGFSPSDMIIDVWVTMQPNLVGYGFGLVTVYIVWIAVIMALYPICRWYNQYKSNNRHIWWLSYL